MPRYVEESLDLPMAKVLQILQEGVMYGTTYFGVRTLKNPLDAWIYQELLHETQPDVIIEIGNANGGSALLLAHLCDNLGKGRVIGLDINQKEIPQYVRDHPRIRFIEGDARQNIEQVEKLVSKDERVLIIEDSAHTYDMTLDLLRLYSKFVKPGDYFIIEDSIVNHGLESEIPVGPYEAIEVFAAENRDFVIDRTRERFLITWNPKGFLKCVSSGGGTAGTMPSRPLNRTAGRWRETVRRFIPPILLEMYRSMKRPR